MNRRPDQIAITGLRWTLGLVVLLESLHFTLSPSTVHHLEKAGLPPWVRFALGGSEVLAALLFLIPAASYVGGLLLLLIFAIAAALHLLRGEFDVGALVVYGMAAIVCMTQRTGETAAASHERE
jgi:uncharacterized membrane protein YphA (DoxX/SURF4 family)